ncbi:MAG: hypothetical protein A2511_11120 [Deltaproteobacteria bacterium RIFOXYD12_FULL_50_9]|nr:MAG: hypothetical protein A2511_11120 [Deltaproteobacteria bacterium RIFOXYD12_FULL_50_9]
MPKIKILIAEDSKSIQFLYNKALPDAFFEKSLVLNGEEALQAYKTQKPDIILLDMHMPLLNGYQTLKILRENFKDTATTIVMVTSSSDKEDVMACAKLGIQGYIVKPFTVEELPQLLMKYHRAKSVTA